MKKNLLAISLLCCLTATAQNNASKEPYFNHLFMEDGLPLGQVTFKLQDKEGYMWIGSINGLIRYDGHKPKTYMLPSNVTYRLLIMKIFEDERGELWVGTNFQGLYHYDRTNDKFIQYKNDPGINSTISKGSIHEITDDKAGNIWIDVWNDDNKESVVNCFNQTTQQFKHYGREENGSYKINCSQVFSLLRDKVGNIWFGSDNGLYLYDNNKRKFIPHFSANDTLKQKTFKLISSAMLSAESLWTVVNNKTDNSTELWFYNITENKVKKYFLKRKEPYGIGSDTAFAITSDSKNFIWISSPNKLAMLDPATGLFTSYPLTDTTRQKDVIYVYELKSDNEGNLWCASSSGLGYFNEEKKTFTLHNESLILVFKDDAFGIKNFYIDHFGTLWFTAVGTGVLWKSISRSRYTLYTNNPGQKHHYSGGNIYACTETRDGTIWMATSKGLYRWKPFADSFESIKLDVKLPLNDLLTSIVSDTNGMIWYGSKGSSDIYNYLYCYNPATKKTRNFKYSNNFIPSQNFNNRGIEVLYMDHTGAIWIGTWGNGLCKFNKDSGNFTYYPYIINSGSTPNNSKLDDDQVTGIYEDKENIIWVTTNQGSLNKLNKTAGTFISYQNNLFQSTAIASFQEDNLNRLWCGTYCEGLILFDKKTGTGKRITEKDGLLSNNIRGILQDNDKNLWIKTARGISIINATTNKIRNLTDDILHEIKEISRCFKMRNGSFVIPSKYGFVKLDPDDFSPDTITPIVHIETINFTSKRRLTNEQFDSTFVRYNKPAIWLRYNENRVTFNYVGLLYQITSQVTYRYKLDGADNNWIEAGTQRSVTYINLAPGTYTFHVMAANSDGVWSTKEDAIEIIISPPWWQTGWFRVLLILAIAGLIFLYVQLYLHRKLKAQQQQLERLKEIEQIRSKISMDIHDEIGSELTKISLFSQRIKAGYQNQQGAEPEMIDKIVGSSKRVINNLSEIIWAVNPKHDNLQSLLAYVRDHAVNFLDQARIEACISFPDQVRAITIPPDVKHNIFLVTKEILNNIVKHACASKVEMLFTATNDTYTYCITDNGKGMDNLNGRAFGNGLINMQKRMNTINGTITIHSQKGLGTRIVLEGRFI